MIKHCVLLRIKTEASQETIDRIFQGLAELKGKCAGVLDFCGGPYDSPEGLDRGFTHGFIMSFDTEDNRNAYLTDPDHEAVKQLIEPNLEGGIDGVVAFDFIV